ncbi:MAG: LptF/LptG family permease [Bacteroidales bacterium]|nr:LptF/LptG family permease [Bacteroidales bacterium]
MFKILDRYLMKKFLGTFFYSLVLLISIIIVFDIQEKLDDFIEKKAPFDEILFDYYLNFAPYYANMFMFLFIFISVIFFTSKLAGNSEIIAILSAGISYRRMLVPYFQSAALLALLSFFLSAYIIPPATEIRLKFENTYIKSTYQNNDRNIHRQVNDSTYLYLQSYVAQADLGYKFSWEVFNGKQLKEKLLSEYINWDSTKNKWTISNYYIKYYINDKVDSVVTGKKMDTTLAILPKDFNQRINHIETLTSPELSDYIEEQQMRGSENIEAFLVEKYKRIAFPFASFILTLIGVTLSSKKVRGGIGINLGVGLGLSFSYILFMQIFTEFAKGSTLPTLLAVWIPNIIYLIIGIVLYWRTPK